MIECCQSIGPHGDAVAPAAEYQCRRLIPPPSINVGVFHMVRQRRWVFAA